ncbi:MAG: histidine phosphatase family protein [Deinococcales bacterium]
MNHPPLRLVLVRHGVTEWNLEGRWQGWSDTPLSKLGSEQAWCLRERLESMEFNQVHSSDLTRALDTARTAGFEPQTDARLRELNFGVFEGSTNAENAVHPDFAAWIQDPVNRNAPMGESYASLRARAMHWLESLPQSGQVLAFSHGGLIQVLTCALLELSPLAAPRIWRLRITHASITILERHWTPYGAVWLCERLNDTAHLEQMQQVRSIY